ncbi:NCS2 family permease [Actinomyces sp. zg-332]|uniref:NCS2 family permease n=1 Tax=Actinomyces sp. zg-332 TaxID=2708340 RepID=UPI00141F5A3C|nr:NCS2 family permease [Actinomyces sp. zg-332]QPK94717.1 NCS2 family permease [Actinomyces sp. zg-332]
MSEKTGIMGRIDRYFEITKRGSTFGREIRGGIVTFFAMSYILVLNPIILSAGKDSTGSFLGGGSAPNIAAISASTALVAGIMTILMGVIANFPLALAAGMGINAMVSFSLVLGSGLTWQEAMGIIVLEGVFILFLVLVGLREAVFRAVPSQLKMAISVGIGLFITLIGLIDAGIIRPGGTPIQLGINGSLAGWPALVFVFGLFVTIILFVRKVSGSILIGIISSTVLAMVIQYFAGLPTKSDKVPTGWGLNIPEFKESLIQLPDFSTLGQFDIVGPFTRLGVLAVILIVFSLMLADFFDTMGTMVAVGAEAGLLGKDDAPPRTTRILIIDSLAAVAGGASGTSSATSYVESSAGVADGARTGLASVTTGLMFLLATFFAPLVEVIPSEAASTALVAVGFLMMTQIAEIDWKNWEYAIPAFMTIAMMPFAYSITVGIGAGFITYTIIQLAKGNWKQHYLIWFTTVLFILYFVIGPIQGLFQ